VACGSIGEFGDGVTYIPASYKVPVATDPNMVGLYTKFLCHCDGTNGQTTNTDSSLFGMTIGAFSGGAQVSTAQKKFGTGSLAFNGSNTGGVFINNSGGNIYFGGDDFTIECWYYVTTKASPYDHLQPIIAFRGAGNDYGPIISVETGSGTHINAYISYAGTPSTLLSQGSDVAPSVGAWHHLALCRDNNYLLLWIDGSLQTSQRTILRNTVVNAGANMYIGYDPASALSMNGYVDEIRITCGLNRYPAGPFNAANPTNPGAFTPPVAAFTDPSAISAQAVGTMHLDGSNAVYIDNSTTKHRVRLNTLGADERYLIG
jgi:hypothetical protein